MAELMSIRLQIRDAVIAALNVAAKPANVPEVKADSYETISAGEGPAMSVLFLSDDPQPQPTRGFPLTRRVLHIGVECKWYADLPELRDNAIEPLMAWAVAALGSTNLGGLVLSVDEDSTLWERRQADHLYVRAIVQFKIEYQTKRNDLTKKQ